MPSPYDCDEPEDQPKKNWLFKRDISTIPCFRESFMYGIMSGIATGLGHFMLTSRVGRSTHVGFGTWIVVTNAYWFYCRYDLANSKFQAQKLKKYMSVHVQLEGTEEENNVEIYKSIIEEEQKNT